MGAALHVQHRAVLRIYHLGISREIEGIVKWGETWMDARPRAKVSKPMLRRVLLMCQNTEPWCSQVGQKNLSLGSNLKGHQLRLVV